jgi:hypothetical protein
VTYIQRLVTKQEANALLGKFWVKHNMILLIWKTQYFKTGFMWFAGEIRGNCCGNLAIESPLQHV